MSERELLHTDRVLVVEGKYDAARLSHLTDAMILLTDGFGIYKDKKRQQLLKTLAKKNGLILFTDSDAAGCRIRTYITGLVGAENVVQAYVPAIHGKEKRKPQPGKEGLLGVEGVDDAIVLQCLRDALGAEAGAAPARPEGRQITYTDLYNWGLSGTPGSAERKYQLLNALGLPPRLSKKELVEALNRLYSFEQLDIQRHHQGKPCHHADDPRRFVCLHGFRNHLLCRHTDHTPGGKAHQPGQGRTDPPGQRKGQQAPQRLHKPGGSPRRKGTVLRPALLRQRQADRSSLGNVLQPDAQRKGQRPADGIRFSPQGQRGSKAHHHALGQVVQGDCQHHPPTAARPGIQQAARQRFQPQKPHRTQQQAHGRWDPCRQRPLLCPLNGRQKQAPYAGRQHDARRHAAEHPPGGRLPGLPQQEHTSRTGRGAEHRQQQHCRRQENLFQIALPLFPVYAKAAGGVQRATLNRIFKTISAKFS